MAYSPLVAGGVDGEFAQEFAGGDVDDSDVEVLDEHGDVGSGVGSSDADVVHFAACAQCDGTGFVDAVVVDSFVSFAVAAVAG